MWVFGCLLSRQGTSSEEGAFQGVVDLTRAATTSRLTTSKRDHRTPQGDEMPAKGLINDSWTLYAARKVAKGPRRKASATYVPYVEKQPPLFTVLRDAWRAGYHGGA